MEENVEVKKTKLDRYYELWAEDAVIDQMDLVNESSRIGALYAKWYQHFYKEKKILNKVSTDYSKLYEDKKIWALHRDARPIPELVEQYPHWKQHSYKPNHNNVDNFLNTDPELIQKGLVRGQQDAVVGFLEGILKLIQNRSFHINAMIESQKLAGNGLM